MWSVGRIKARETRSIVDTVLYLEGACAAARDHVFDPQQEYLTYSHIAALRSALDTEGGRPMYVNVNRYGQGLAYWMREVYRKSCYIFEPRIEVIEPEPHYTQEEADIEPDPDYGDNHCDCGACGSIEPDYDADWDTAEEW